VIDKVSAKSQFMNIEDCITRKSTSISLIRKMYAEFLRFLPVVDLRFTLFTHRRNFTAFSVIKVAWN